MIRLKKAYLFQEIKCGEANQSTTVTVFFDQPAGVSYPGRVEFADIVLDDDKGLIYIRERKTQRIHIVTANNLKSCEPYQEDVPDVWAKEKVLTEWKEMDRTGSIPVIKKRMGRPPKVRLDAPNSVG